MSSDELENLILRNLDGLLSPAEQADLEAVVRPGLDGVRIPKAESLVLLAACDADDAGLEAQRGLEPGSIRQICNSESAAGLFLARSFGALPRVERLAFGAADCVAELGGYSAASTESSR